MRTQHAKAAGVEPPTQLLIESQSRPEPGAGCRFLRAARHLAAAGTPTLVFLLDDGVSCAVGFQPEVARAVKAGASVWADDVSLAERGIPVDDLVPGVVPAGLPKITPLLYDPAVKVVWH